METVVYYALLAAGFGTMWWQHARSRRAAEELRRDLFDDEAEVALHLAAHEARSRQQPASPVHLLYALIQDEATAAAMRRTGIDVDAVEDRVFTAMEDGTTVAEDNRRINQAASWACYRMAERRRITCTDLWAGLVHTAPETMALIDDGGVGGADVLYTLVHGVAERDVEIPERGEVEVVLMNDDMSTQELVVELLREVFGLDDDASVARMMETHTTGSAPLGYYPATEARDKIDAARAIARSQGFPLRFHVVTPP